MANHGETSSPEIHCIFVETNLDTCLALPVHKDETIFDFKDKLYKQHKQVFPEIGDINIVALKVKRRGKFFRLSESMSVYKAFDGFRKNWFMYVDAVRVEKGEVPTIMAADDKGSNLELVKEFAIGSILEDGHTKDLVLEEGLETEVVEKHTRKRKIKSSDGKASRKKSKVDLNQSVVDTSEVCRKLLGEFASQSCEVSPKEKLDDILMRTDSDNGKKNGFSTRENQQTLEADKLLDENIVTVNPDLVDGHNMDVVKDVPDNQTVKEVLEKLDDLTGAIEQDLEKDGKTTGVVMIDQEKELPPPSEFVDGQITSHDTKRDEGSTLAPSAVDNLQTTELVTNAENQLEASSGLATSPAKEKKRKRKKSSKEHINQSPAPLTTTSSKIVNEINDVTGNVDCVDAPSKSCPSLEIGTLKNPLLEAIQKEKGSTLAPSAVDNLQTTELVTNAENQLEATSGLATSPAKEKKRKRKRSSKEHINQSPAPLATTSSKIVNEINDVTGNVVCVDAPSKSCPSLEIGTLKNPLLEEIQKETEMGMKSVDDVGIANVETDNLASHPENHVEANSGLTTSPVTEKKKKKRKKSSKDHINQTATTATASREIVNKITGVSENVDRADTTSEFFPASRGNLGIENEMGEKITEDVGSKKAMPCSADNIHTDNLVSYPENQLVVNNDLTTGPATGKKKKQKKSSKDHINKSTAATITSKKIVNEEENVSGAIDCNDATSDTPVEAIQNENEIGDKIVYKVGSREANADMGDNFGSSQKDNIVGSDKQDQATGGAKPNMEKKSLDLHHGGSIDGSIKAKERKGRVEPSSSGTSQLQSKAMNDYSGTKVDQSDASAKGAVINKKEAVKKNSNSAIVMKRRMNHNNKEEAVKKNSNSVAANKTKTNFFKDFFKDAEKWNSGEDESSKTISHVSTKTPLDSSSEDDSDVTSMSRKQGNNLVGGTNRFSGSLQEILRSSKSYKAAKLTASQSQPDDFDDESPKLDVVPDSQVI